MNGATALLCAKTRSRPSRISTIAIGASQYFFSCRKKSTNSLRTDPRLITGPSIQMVVVIGIAQPWRRRRPGRRHRAPAPAETVAAEGALQQTVGRDDDEEEDRQEDAAVHPAERSGEPHPDAIGRVEQSR